MEQTAAHVSRVISSAPSNAAESARPSSGSAQQDTKLYTPTDGRPVGFVDVADVVDAVVLVVKVDVVDAAVLVVKVDVVDAAVLVVKVDVESVVLVVEVEVEGEEDVVEDKEAAEVVVVAEEFDDLSWYRERRRPPPQISVALPEQTSEQSVDGAA